MRTFRPHKTRLSSLTFSPDGKLLATTAGQSKHVWLWEAGTGEQFRRLWGQYQPAKAVAFSPDGEFVAALQAGPNITVWSAVTAGMRAILELDSGGSKTLAFSPDGTSLVAPDFGHVFRWNEPSVQGSAYPRPPDERLKITRGAERVGFTPLGRLVTAAQGVVTVHRLPGTDEPSREFDTPVGYQSAVNDFAFTRDESRLVVGYGNRVAAVWDLTAPGSRPVLLKGHKGHVRAVGFTADGRNVVTASLDGTTRLWDAATGAETRVFDWQLGRFTVAAVAPDGLTCAAGTDNGTVVVWDLDT